MENMQHRIQDLRPQRQTPIDTLETAVDMLPDGTEILHLKHQNLLSSTSNITVVIGIPADMLAAPGDDDALLVGGVV